MIALMFRALELAWHVHHVYPAAPIARVAVAAYAAAAAETEEVRGETLLAIAEHESDLRSRAVSWRRGGRRVDKVVDNELEIPRSGRLACGLVQTIAPDRAGCAKLLTPTAAMLAGVAELTEELHVCRGATICALSLYAGGQAGRVAWEAGVDTDATRFARHFAQRARQLGAP